MQPEPAGQQSNEEPPSERCAGAAGPAPPHQRSNPSKSPQFCASSANRRLNCSSVTTLCLPTSCARSLSRRPSSCTPAYGSADVRGGSSQGAASNSASRAGSRLARPGSACRSGGQGQAELQRAPRAKQQASKQCREGHWSLALRACWVATHLQAIVRLLPRVERHLPGAASPASRCRQTPAGFDTATAQ